MVYDPHKHWHLLQIRAYFFIFVSKRENCLCPLLKDPRGPRTITVLWFISLTAQSEVQRGDICFAFCARNFQGFVYVCSFVLSSENFTLLGHACTCSVASFESDICDPMDCSHQAPLHGILQVRIPEWVAISFSRGFPRPRDRTCLSWVSCFAGRVFNH